MADTLTPEQRRRAMQLVKTKDGPLEVAIRSALHRKGYRFRKHVKTLPGKPDVVFTKRKVAVFIDGDYWHGYEFEKWRHKMAPYWQKKIDGNIARDERNFAALREMGWVVIRLWGHEVKKDLSNCIARIESELRSPRTGTTKDQNSVSSQIHEPAPTG
jgi:DNA mismatch endonuclease (patch repair protein)